jgi:hypothetical protein
MYDNYKTMKKQTGQDTYFSQMSEAIDHAKGEAMAKGFQVIENPFIFSPVNYGQTGRFTLELLKNDKPQKKCLVIILYRMESGKYELTNYIN